MTYLKLEHMPGPTPEARAAQYRQHELLQAYYDVANAARHEETPAVKEARAAYSQSVKSLTAMLGPDVPYYFVDCELADLFSDFYKEVVGIRPRTERTRKQVLEWCAQNGWNYPED
jgi:hypothetical protein